MADNIRATPQSPTLGAIASALRKAQQFAGQYQVDPRIPLLGGTSIDELLSLPGAASLAEDVSYNGPRALIRGGNVATGGIGTFRPDPRITDVADVALNATPLAMLAGKGLGRGAVAVGRAGARAAERAVPSIMERGGAGAAALQALAGNTTSNVVKPKGGNWLQGGVEHSLRQLQRGQEPVLSGEIVNDAAGRDIFSEYRKAYDQNPELSLYAWTRKNYPEVYASLQEPEERAVSRWIDTKLGKYIRNEMATPQDPVRALAERGVLHVPPEQLNYRLEAHGVRKSAPEQEFMAQSDPAKMWEGASDLSINIAQPQDYLKYSGDTAHRQTIAENPWLKTVPEDTKIYSPAESELLASDLGFDHLIDELKFSMSPDSDLPRHLRFDPKDVDKITVPQVVERVAEINAWRAKQAAEAEKAGMMENLKATPRLPDEGLQLSFVDKPGGAWVDIPETVDDKGMKLCNSIGKAGGWCTQAEWAAKSYGSGDNRLTALVDAEGRPHAQAKITTTKVDVENTQRGDVLEEEDAIADQFYSNIDTILQERGVDPDTISDVMDYVAAGGSRARVPEEILDILPEVEAQAEAMLPKLALPKPDITELKPPGNSFDSERAQEYAKRDPQYKQKVTDSVLRFLNNGEWGKVNDLHHYDIVDLGDTHSVMNYLDDIYDGDRDAYLIFNAAIDGSPMDMPRFMTRSDFIKFLAPYDKPEGFAGGGLVKGAVKSMGEMVEKYLAKEAPEDVGTTFYRGIPRLKGDVEEISGLHAKERGKPVAASPHLKANTRGYAWASDNPMVASSYTHFGGAVVPLELTEKPGAVLDARGLPWNLFFFQKVPQWVDPKQKMLLLKPEFREALDDPNVRSVLVKNIKDYGMESEKPAFREMLSQRLFQKPFNELNRDQQYELFTGAGLTGNNLLIKDPSIMRYKFTGEAPGFAGGGIVKGAVKGIGEMVEKYLAKESAAPVEQKMLQGVYRGYAGEDPGEVVYHAGADFQQPRPGLFTTPERAAAEQFQRFTGAPKLHTLEAKPRRTGTEEDVYAVARRLGIYNPGVPASQYLEQGENAVFPESAAVVEELRNQGLDALRLRDGISKQPSLVALDPGVVRPAPELFATPQRRVAEYYANKRAAQTGERPHLEMLLVDPFAGRQYGHSTMGTGKQEPMTTRARKLPSEQVQGRTKLYAAGGAVSAPTLTAYDPNEIDTIVSRMKEEFNV